MPAVLSETDLQNLEWVLAFLKANDKKYGKNRKTNGS